MKFKSNKIIHYNFPTIDSNQQKKLPNTFFIFKNIIPLKSNNIKINNLNNNKIICESMFDTGSYCNFISSSLVKKLKLNCSNTINNITIKGISGSTIINKFINLNFQFLLFIKNKFYLVNFKEKFLVTDKIPTDLLIGNKFMNKYELHYNYKNKSIYTNFNYFQLIKILRNNNKSKNINYILLQKIFQEKFQTLIII